MHPVFGKAKRYKDGQDVYCKVCRSKLTIARSLRDPEKRRQERINYRRKHHDKILLDAAKARASKGGLPFTITREDIVVPAHCPVFGFPLVVKEASRYRGHSFNSPSVDRIIPRLGYVPGNIMVMSILANTMKQNATPEQLVAFAKWILRTQRKNGTNSDGNGRGGRSGAGGKDKKKGPATH
jgi:hypothetical protein